uniref:Uncharacterized protein n=1 Tax=Rhizophagus irregularis (strain DAOM 181602 / DAOM 197198 / MUCL 43194) TaxID=747089 RepID=U9UBA6_RHIID
MHVWRKIDYGLILGSTSPNISSLKYPFQGQKSTPRIAHWVFRRTCVFLSFKFCLLFV